MAECTALNKLKLATVTPMREEKDTLIQNHDGTLISVHHAANIRALAKGLGVTFNVVMPEDDTFGYKKPDGNWTGIVGMLLRGEADLSIGSLSVTEERREAVNFSYPLHVTDITFMTNKPEPQPKSFALFDVFSLEVWIGIGTCLILVSSCLYFLLKRREPFSKILIESIGCLLEKSFSFDARQRNTALLLLHWLIAITVLANSYKAVILSIITVPKMVGIRDITDLSKAAKAKSAMCMTYEGYQWFNSNDDTFKPIDDCLKRSETESLYGHPDFFKYPRKKVFIADRIDISQFSTHYFISDDKISISYIGIAYSKQFCFRKKLDSIVHRIVAADLYPKFLRDGDFTGQLSSPKRLGIVADKAPVAPLKLEDFSGAFLVLFAGYLFSLLVFVAEIASKRCVRYVKVIGNIGRCPVSSCDLIA